MNNIVSTVTINVHKNVGSGAMLPAVVNLNLLVYGGCRDVTRDVPYLPGSMSSVRSIYI